jgi:hypothetical protein
VKSLTISGRDAVLSITNTFTFTTLLTIKDKARVSVSGGMIEARPNEAEGATLMVEGTLSLSLASIVSVGMSIHPVHLTPIHYYHTSNSESCRLIARPCSLVISNGGKFLIGMKGNEAASRLDKINVDVKEGAQILWDAGPFVLDDSIITIQVTPP